MNPDENKEYYEYMKLLQDTEAQQWKFYDSALLSLSAGALVLSVTLLGTVFKGDDISHENLLIWSWISWTSCIAFILCSYIASIFGIRKARRERAEGKMDKLGDPWYTIVMIFNVLSAIPFLTGSVTLTIFAIWNL